MFFEKKCLILVRMLYISTIKNMHNKCKYGRNIIKNNPTNNKLRLLTSK